MTRIVFPLLLALNVASAVAFDLPCQEATPGEPPQYCRGFVAGGLASKQVSGSTRTDLWLAWSYAIRSGALQQSASADEYQTGLARLQNVPDAAAATEILQNANGQCGLGRTGHQITGW